VSANDLARSFAVASATRSGGDVPRASWEGLFRSQGTKNPLPRIRMLDGFNEGWIAFRDQGRLAVKGGTPLSEAIEALVAASVRATRLRQ